MKFLLACVLLSLTTSTIADESVLRLIGHYTNMRMSSGPDVHFLSGYNVSLFQLGNKQVGYLAAAIGSEEPVAAALYDLAYNPTTKQLHFKAKYSDGRDYGKGLPSDGRDARIMLEFNGSMSPARLIGKIQLRDGYNPTAQPSSKRVVLKRTRETFVPDNYADWIKHTVPQVHW